MDFRKAVNSSKGVFKPQHCEWAKCTVGTDGTLERGKGWGMNRKGRDCGRDVDRWTVEHWREQDTRCSIYVKWSRYRSSLAQSLGRNIAVSSMAAALEGSVVSSTPRQHVIPGKGTVPIAQEAWWSTGPLWTGGISRPQRDSIPDLIFRSLVPISAALHGPHIYKYIHVYIK